MTINARGERHDSRWKQNALAVSSDSQGVMTALLA
jgi:hypothetical protein